MMEDALCKEVENVIDVYIDNYDGYDNGYAEETQKNVDIMKNFTPEDIRKIARQINDDEYLWEMINESINDTILEYIETNKKNK